MKRLTIPAAGLDAPAVILGMMRIANMSDAEIRALVRTARDSGIDYVDHADIYGRRLHECEERFAAAMQLGSAEREAFTIQTKVGIADGYYDSSYEHLVHQVNGSLRALRTDVIDVLLLHRPDALVEPEEVARAVSDLVSAGKVRHVGVSNHAAGQIELLQAALDQQIAINQVQLSIVHSPIITQGMAANMVGLDQAVVRDGGGLLDYCRINNITIQAWSPFQGDHSVSLFDRSRYRELNEMMDGLADKYAVEPAAIATAWIARHPAAMQTIVGTTRPERLRAAAAGADLQLSRPEWYGLLQAAGWSIP